MSRYLTIFQYNKNWALSHLATPYPLGVLRTFERSFNYIDNLPEKRTLVLSWLTAFGSSIGSVCFITDRLSPVRIDWSTLTVVLNICDSLTSAGILSPIEMSTMSPGTNSRARIYL